MKKLNEKKEELLKKAMGDFEKNKGGKSVEKEFTDNGRDLKAELQHSFDAIFPELTKKQKLRKHIIFDEDVFEAYEGLSKTQDCSLSALVNSALRNYVNEKFRSPASTTSLSIVFKELSLIKEREDELMNLVKTLKEQGRSPVIIDKPLRKKA